MKKKVLSIILSIFIMIPSFADEGMWLLTLLGKNYEQMKAQGFKLTPEDIYNVNNASLKDAIVRMGGGFCTAEIISKEGLLLTNHHCGYDKIQNHSSVENDYLTDGFWAMTRDQELPNEGLEVSILHKMEDVTAKVQTNLNDSMSEDARAAAIKSISDKIIEEATKGTNYTAQVKNFFGGNEFYLFIFNTYKDVRLVGAPPSSIGKFGGDTDNWMWPRHTGDFCLFRIYTDKDGNPAEYATSNKPLVPKHHLPISMNGVKPGDFAMVMGFPGSTDRYLTSYGVKQATSKEQPTHVEVRGKILEVMKKDMNASKKVRIMYASKYAGVSNYWKYFIGQTQGLKRLKVYEQKKAIENKFKTWMMADAERKKKYGKVLDYFKEAYDMSAKTIVGDVYMKELLLFGNFEAVIFSYQIGQIYGALRQGAKKEDLKKQIQEFREGMKEHFKEYNAPTDQKIFAELSKMYFENVPKDQQPSYLAEANAKYQGDFHKYAQEVYSKSIFTDQKRLEAFLDNLKPETVESDPIFAVMQSMLTTYQQGFGKKKQTEDKLATANRLFIDGLRKMNPDENYYPNANSTIRLTYGQVGDYQARDAVHYLHYTTIEGIAEKENPEDAEFVVPKKLMNLYRSKDFGQYKDEEIGNLPVCFITNNDITGGNSGSPVINGKGELIGLAFDGNWEAMSGDIAFETNLQRCINVDIRYVLFIIDKFAGAKHLVDEMTLVKGGDNKKSKKRKKKNKKKK